MAKSKEELLKILKPLIENSISLNSLPADKKQSTIDKMLNSSPEQMEELIKILQEEAVQIAKLSQEEEEKIKEVEKLMQDIKTTETTLKTEIRKEEEKKVTQEDQSKQDELLDELNNV